MYLGTLETSVCCAEKSKLQLHVPEIVSPPLEMHMEPQQGCHYTNVLFAFLCITVESLLIC